MNGVNRVAISLVALLVVVGAIVTLLVAAEAVDPDFLPGGSAEDSWFYQELKGLADFSGTAQGISIGVSIVVALAALGFFFFNVSSFQFRRPDTLQVSSSADGALTVETNSVRLLAERTGISNRNVSSIRCRLGVRRRPSGAGPASIVIACYPRVVLGSDLQEIRDDLQTRIKEAVQNLTGLAVLQVHLARVRYDKGDDSRLIDS